MSNRLQTGGEFWLRLLADINPYLWEAIHGGKAGPGGLRVGRGGDGDPEPWPAKEIGAAVLQGFAMRAALTGDFRRFMTDIQDWCPTPPQDHDIPLPKGSGEPIPHPNWQVFLGAAVAAIELAHWADGDSADQLAAAGSYLFEASQRA